MKLHESTQIFVIADYVREMIVKKSCKCGKHGLFEHLFLFSYLQKKSFSLPVFSVTSGCRCISSCRCVDVDLTSGNSTFSKTVLSRHEDNRPQ